MNQEELKRIIEGHKKWLNDEGGTRADLQSAVLRGASLQGADLRCADLRYADLQGANLRGVDLQGADLRYADLRCADLQGADLRGAYLRCACLRGACLRGAKINWKSHDLIAELLSRAAGDDIEKRKIAGLILVSRDWCWDKFLKIGDPLQDWAIDVLKQYVVDGGNAPEGLRRD